MVSLTVTGLHIGRSTAPAFKERKNVCSFVEDGIGSMLVV